MRKSIILAAVLGLFWAPLTYAAVTPQNKAPANPKAAVTPAHHDFSKIRFKFTAAGGVNILIVSCIDFRLRTELENYATGRFGPDSYDEVALAGAALGVLNDAFPDWHKTFVQNLDVAIKLHGVNTVIFIDHRDCGAFKQIIGADCCSDPAKEKQVHEVQMEKVRQFMKEKYPNMKLETLLMNLDGSVDVLGAAENKAAAEKEMPKAVGEAVKAVAETSQQEGAGADR